MRAAIFNGPSKPITIEPVIFPEPGPDELLVKIHRCGICGSDVSMTAAGAFTYPTGCRMGHEYAGEVVDFGRRVTNFKVGERIACLPCVGCGKCEGCRGGNALFCSTRRGLSAGFAEYIAIPPEAAIALPQTLSLADGALIEPMACGLHALRLARMRDGDRVLVLGAGTIALSIIYWARSLGARTVVVLSRSAHRNDIALTMGANVVHAFEAADPKMLAEALGGTPDIVAECVGKEGMLSRAIDYVRPEGIVISMGMCSQGESLTPAGCTFKEVRMYFPLGYSAAEFVETAKAFESARFHPELMVSDVIALEDLQATIEALRAGRKNLKVHVDPHLKKSAHA